MPDEGGDWVDDAGNPEEFPDVGDDPEEEEDMKDPSMVGAGGGEDDWEFSTTPTVKEDVHPSKLRPCKRCDKTFVKYNKLRVHVILVHGGVKDYRCEPCKEDFYTQYDMQKHNANVHDETRIHRCAQCQAAFREPKRLVQHVKYGTSYLSAILTFKISIFLL